MGTCFVGRSGVAHDGDTLKFSPSINGFAYARLPNINTPEKGQFGHNKAKLDLHRLINGKRLKVCPRAVDRTRLIADVFAGDVDVTKAMKRLGW